MAVLPGFASNVGRTPVFGQYGGQGQQSAVVNFDPVAKASSGIVPLTTTYADLINRTGKAGADVDVIHVGDVGGGTTVTIRMLPVEGATESGTEYTIVATYTLGSAGLLTLLQGLHVPAGSVLQIKAAAAAKGRAVATYTEPIHN